MARPRLYHTDAQRRAANALKSQRYYKSRNKDSIAKKRKKTYRALGQTMKLKGPGLGAQLHPSALVTQAKDLRHGLDKFLSYQSFEGVIVELRSECFPAASGSTSSMKSAREKVEALLIHVQHVRHEITKVNEVLLERVGVQKEWEEVKGLGDKVHAFQRHLEEVVCDIIIVASGLEGYNE
ncbi:hypothetical protein BKA70DRAFT_1225749 [Coprinopsis sp. MPI-PUGE-AT-0042]|nr:hypothetical protein BKA70DRAFT_1225749 [Coprinopsis sp. MPI-PUGE-AT-0042]